MEEGCRHEEGEEREEEKAIKLVAGEPPACRIGRIIAGKGRLAIWDLPQRSAQSFQGLLLGTPIVQVVRGNRSMNLLIAVNPIHCRTRSGPDGLRQCLLRVDPGICMAVLPWRIDSISRGTGQV